MVWHNPSLQTEQTGFNKSTSWEFFESSFDGPGSTLTVKVELYRSRLFNMNTKIKLCFADSEKDKNFFGSLLADSMSSVLYTH